MGSKSVKKLVVGYFLKGLLYTVPIAILGYIIYQLFIFFDSLVPLDIPGLGILLLLAFITVMGFLGSTIIGQPIVRYFERLISKVPLLKTLYSAITDLLSAFVGTKKRFNQPVLVKVSSDSELEKLGFITSEDLTTLGIQNGKIAVYLPHSYNFSGNLFIVPRENVTAINHPTPEVMKFIVSGGITQFDK